MEVGVMWGGVRMNGDNGKICDKHEVISVFLNLSIAREIRNPRRY